MKKLRIVKVSFGLTIIIGCLLLNIKAWNGSQPSLMGYFSQNKDDAINNKSIIATYIGVINGHQETLRIERMKMQRGWKYIFYTPKFYSKEFYVNNYSMPANIKYIIAGQDTVATHTGISPLKQLPKKLKIYLINEESKPIDFFIDERFTGNINEIAKVSFFEKIDSGPFLNDD